MATRVPNPLKRRHLIEQKLDPAKARKIADAYLEEGRRFEAIAFLQKAEDREALASLRAAAVEEGEPFLLRQSCRALDEEPSADEWRSVARRAREEGRIVEAEDAERQASAAD